MRLNSSNGKLSRRRALQATASAVLVGAFGENTRLVRRATAPSPGADRTTSPAVSGPASLRDIPGVTGPDDALLASAVQKYAHAFDLTSASIQVNYQSSQLLSGETLVSANVVDGTPLLLWHGDIANDGTAGWHEATTRTLADRLGIAFGAPFAWTTARWTGTFGDPRKDTAYIDAYVNTVNCLYIDGPLYLTSIWRNFTADDWRKIPDNWASVKSQLDRSSLPSEVSYDFAGAQMMVDVAKQYGMSIRQTNLIWDGDVPPALFRPGFSDDELVKIAEFVVKVKVLRFKGTTSEWIATSELIARSQNKPKGDIGRFWYDHLGGTDMVEKLCRWAREVDPDIKLSYAEDDILETTFPRQPALLNAYMDLLRQWKTENVPISGVDIENNFWTLDPPNKSHMLQVMRAIKDLGYEISLPEVTVSVSDIFPSWENRPKVLSSVSDPFRAQAQIYRDTIDTYLDVGASFGLGDIGDFGSWHKDVGHPEAKAMVLDDDMQPKPAYYALTKAMSNRIVSS
jgi:endo-1,4-beta-xylanase